VDKIKKHKTVIPEMEVTAVTLHYQGSHSLIVIYIYKKCEFNMSKVKRKWDILDKDKKRYMINEIIGYFQNERDEEIGIVAASEILDFFLQNLHDEIYNKAVNDVKSTVKEGVDGIQIDLDLMLNK